MLFACDNRQNSCIEAGDFENTDFAELKVLAAESTADDQQSCEYSVVDGGYLSTNSSLFKCLNGNPDFSDSGSGGCEETYDGYVGITYPSNSNDIGFRCRFVNNDSADGRDLVEKELVEKELSCFSPLGNPYQKYIKNKGCNFTIKSASVTEGLSDYDSTTAEATEDMIFYNKKYHFYSSTNTPSWSEISPYNNTASVNIPRLSDIKKQCEASCVARCKEKRACSHVKSRLNNSLKDANSDPQLDSIYYPYIYQSSGKIQNTKNITNDLESDPNNIGRIFPIALKDANSDLQYKYNQNNKIEFFINNANIDLLNIFNIAESKNNIITKNMRLFLKKVSNSNGDVTIANLDNFTTCEKEGTTIIKCTLELDNINSQTKDKLLQIAPNSTECFTSNCNIKSQVTVSGGSSYDQSAHIVFNFIKLTQSNNSTCGTITSTAHNFDKDAKLLFIKWKGDPVEVIVASVCSNKKITISPKIAKTIIPNCNSSDSCYLINISETSPIEFGMPRWVTTDQKFSRYSPSGVAIPPGAKVTISASGNIRLKTDEGYQLYYLINNTSGSPARNQYLPDLLDSSKTTQKYLLQPNSEYSPILISSPNAVSYINNPPAPTGYDVLGNDVFSIQVKNHIFDDRGCSSDSKCRDNCYVQKDTVRGSNPVNLQHLICNPDKTDKCYFKNNVNYCEEIKNKMQSYNLYRELKESEINSIGGDSDDCKNRCYVKNSATAISINDIACEIEKCKYSGSDIDKTINNKNTAIADYLKRTVVVTESTTPVANLDIDLDNANVCNADCSISSYAGLIEKETAYSKIAPSGLTTPLAIYLSSTNNCDTNVSVIDVASPPNLYENTKGEGEKNIALTSIAKFATTLYPNAKLKIQSSNCNNINISAYKYAVYDANQSGFIKFKTNGNRCQMKGRIINPSNNPNKIKSSESVSKKLLMHILQAITNSFTANAQTPPNLNNQGQNASNTFLKDSFCIWNASQDSCDNITNSPAISNGSYDCTTSASALNCSTTAASPCLFGCGGIGSLTTTPINGGNGYVKLVFSGGETIELFNPGIYEINLSSQNYILEATLIGAGGGGSQDFTSPLDQIHSGLTGNTVKLSGTIGIKDTNYLIDGNYKLKIIVGKGGANSTLTNKPMQFGGTSHRPSNDYAMYPVNVGYIGAGGGSTLIGLLTKDSDSYNEKIKIILSAGGGGNSAGKYCTLPSVISGLSADLANLPHNANYHITAEMIQKAGLDCPANTLLAQVASVVAYDCNNTLYGSPAVCASNTCNMTIANTINDQFDASTNVANGSKVYCILGYVASYIGTNTSLFANCVAGGSALAGGSCNANKCTLTALNSGNNYSKTTGENLPNFICNSGYQNFTAITCNPASPSLPCIDGNNKIRCNSSGSPASIGACSPKICAITNIASTANQDSQNFVRHADTVYCIKGYNSAGSSLIADCENNPGYLTGGLCSPNSCNVSALNATANIVTNTGTDLSSISFTCPANNYYAPMSLADQCVSGQNCIYTDSSIKKIKCINSIYSPIQIGSCNLNICNSVVADFGGGTATIQGSFKHSDIITNCNPGYSGSLTIACSSNGGTATISGGSCSSKTCTIAGVAGIDSAISRTHNSVVYCLASHSKSGNMFADCSSAAGTISGGGSCTIKTCTAPSAPTGYALPAGFTYSYTITPATITGASCASGYSGTPQYTCDSNRTINLSGCNANCPALSNANVNSSSHNGTATCNAGYFSSTGGVITCNNGSWNGSCTINTCTAPSAPTGYALPAGFTYSYTTTSTTIAGASCASGYSGTPQYTCNASSVGSSTPATLSGCAINTCTVPAATGYSNLPATVNYATTQTTITGASCASGYSGTPQYTCNASSVGSSTPATLSGCAINTCTVPATTGYGNLPATVNYTTTQTTIAGASCATGYSGTPQYTCNATSAGSSTPATLSGCTINTCNIANVSGSSMHNTLVSCNADYGIFDKQTAYAYCPTNGGAGTLRTAQNGGGSTVSCEQKFYEEYKGEFNEHSSPVFYSNGNYNMRYLRVEYGRWWGGCFFGTGTCWNTYYTYDAYGVTEWTLNVNNNICGDPKPSCDKKAKVWVGYCLRNHCLD